ncbi:hypothetical protein HK102_009027, partial [Quaeritorhiza haematococci]
MSSAELAAESALSTVSGISKGVDLELQQYVAVGVGLVAQVVNAVVAVRWAIRTRTRFTIATASVYTLFIFFYVSHLFQVYFVHRNNYTFDTFPFDAELNQNTFSSSRSPSPSSPPSSSTSEETLNSTTTTNTPNVSESVKQLTPADEHLVLYFTLSKIIGSGIYGIVLAVYNVLFQLRFRLMRPLRPYSEKWDWVMWGVTGGFFVYYMVFMLIPIPGVTTPKFRNLFVGLPFTIYTAIMDNILSGILLYWIYNHRKTLHSTTSSDSAHHNTHTAAKLNKDHPSSPSQLESGGAGATSTSATSTSTPRKFGPKTLHNLSYTQKRLIRIQIIGGLIGTCVLVWIGLLG